MPVLSGLSTCTYIAPAGGIAKARRTVDAKAFVETMAMCFWRSSLCDEGEGGGASEKDANRHWLQTHDRECVQEFEEGAGARLTATTNETTDQSLLVQVFRCWW